MSSHKVTYSAELMINFLQAEIMRPETGFQALQTASGAALLFSIGRDDALYVTVETAGDRHGWARSDISSPQIARDFPGKTGVVCKHFAAAQCVDQTIHLAMVVKDGENDHLYLSLKNAASDTSWTAQPAWTAFKYDDPKHARPKVEIAGVFLSQASDGDYIVVDVIRDPGTSTIFRYYIDPAKREGHAWHPHDVPIDIQSGKYSSCMGRKGDQGTYFVDGIYTAGQIDGTAQLVYAPLYNVFNRSEAPNPARLNLPNRLVPDAIAACRNADNTSDLYAAAGGKLFYFSSENQEDDATAVLAAESKLFNGVRNLFAFTTEDNKVMVWGLNANNEIFYTACPLDQLTGHPNAWSVALPILTGVEQVSPFMNRAYSANSFFAHTGTSKLTKAVKSPGTALWTFSDITLPPPKPNAPAQSFSSYTTRIQVADAEGQPSGNVAVSISSKDGAVASVYINHLYYVISGKPIEVKTDVSGAVTIIEAVRTVAGTQLMIGVDGATIHINPMDKAFQKSASLTTKELIKDAEIHTPNGPSRKLVAAGTSDALLDQVAANNQKLAEAYRSRVPAPAVLAGAARVAVASSEALPAHSILVDIGDFFAWLGNKIVEGFRTTVRWIKDAATGLWNFVCEIAGQIYHAVLETVEAVVAAAEWIYQTVKTAVQDLIKYLEVLFDVDDLRRTKEVLKNITKLFLNHQADQILVIKEGFDKVILDAEAALKKWAGTPDFAGLGSDGAGAVGGKSDASATQSAPGALLAHHFQGNAGQTVLLTPAAPQIPPSNPIQILIQALVKEGKIIGDAFDKLSALAENFTRMPLLDALKQLLAVLGEFVLESARNVIDAVFDVIYVLVKAAIKALDEPIYIPVVSDILEFFGVPKFSILDVVCWVAAVPVTIVYKLANGKAPFPATAETAFLATATDFQAVANAFKPQSAGGGGTLRLGPFPSGMSSPYNAPMLAMAAPPTGLITLPEDVAIIVFGVGHGVSGVCSLFAIFIDSLEAVRPDPSNEFGMPSAALAILGGVMAGAANFLVPYHPIEVPGIRYFASSLVALRILCKIGFSNIGQGVIAASPRISGMAVSNNRGVGAVVDAVLVIPQLFCTIWHFVELSKLPEGKSRSIAIIDETSAMTAYLARISYAVAVNTKGIPQGVAIGVMAVSNLCSGGLQIAEGLLPAIG